MSSPLSRRSLLKGAAALGGATLGGPGLIRSAFAQAPRPSAVVMIHFAGGYNALFTSADPFITYNHFGVTSSNVTNLGNGLVVDSSGLGSMPAVATSKMATLGVYHRLSSHDSAPQAEWTNGSRSYALMLANALGGTAPIRCAVVGTRFPDGPHPEENGISMQMISDTSPIVASLGGSTTDTSVPVRTTGAALLQSARAMSANPLAGSPNSLTTVRTGYDSAIAMLTSPTQTFDYAALTSAYGVSTSTTSVSNFATQLMAAELMLNAGCKVVIAVRSGDWDTHGSNPATGERDRAAFAAIAPALRTFLGRVMAPTFPIDVTTAIIGDFARSLPSSDHANFTCATVMGPRVKVGTTGRVTVTRGSALSNPDGGMALYDDRVSINTATPGVTGLWAYLAAAANASTAPFGTNPHALLL